MSLTYRFSVLLFAEVAEMLKKTQTRKLLSLYHKTHFQITFSSCSTLCSRQTCNRTMQLNILPTDMGKFWTQLPLFCSPSQVWGNTEIESRKVFYPKWTIYLHYVENKGEVLLTSEFIFLKAWPSIRPLFLPLLRAFWGHFTAQRSCTLENKTLKKDTSTLFFR